MAVSQPFLAGMPVNSELDTSILHGIDLCIVGATPTPAFSFRTKFSVFWISVKNYIKIIIFKWGKKWQD